MPWMQDQLQHISLWSYTVSQCGHAFLCNIRSGHLLTDLKEERSRIMKLRKTNIVSNGNCQNDTEGKGALVCPLPWGSGEWSSFNTLLIEMGAAPLRPYHFISLCSEYVYP